MKPAKPGQTWRETSTGPKVITVAIVAGVLSYQVRVQGVMVWRHVDDDGLWLGEPIEPCSVAALVMMAWIYGNRIDHAPGEPTAIEIAEWRRCALREVMCNRVTRATMDLAETYQLRALNLTSRDAWN